MEKMSGKCCIHIGRWLCSIVLVMSMVACDDALDNKTPDVPSEKEVSVELSFGFANEEDGYTFSGAGNTRSENALQEGGFSAQLIPNVDTRATADLKPDALYDLHVIQYKQDGTLMGSVQYTSGATEIGTKLTYTLTAANDCQLVIIARGKDNTLPAIGGTLANVQKLTMDKTIFENIPTSGATQAQINKMPYVLYLPHVKVMADGNKGKLQSIDGAYDARLLLKRLATKLTVNWDVNSSLSDYALKEVKLCQIPSAFRILPSTTDTEWGATYPSEVSEFIDFYRLTDTAGLNAKAKTVWIPANARGTSARATSPYYRTKANAPTAASYMELVLDNSDKKERLYYRAYLGGVASTDFNLYENKDYNWTLKINSANYTSDARITLLDQTPVTSSNLVETANSFMMVSGTNICFNPYKHEAGTGGWNTYLTDGTTLNKTIASVKVLWQTKDAGTSGDLVMGYVIDNAHHENLVNVSDIGDKDKALVHVKVPATKGGNAVIAAYAADGTTLWSWHLWVSDYVPVRINSYSEYATAQRSSTNGTVHKWDSPLFAANGVYEKMVMMDRELGAKKGGWPGFTIGDGFTTQDVVNTYGMLYQWGRKDPFFSSADGTNNEVDIIFDGYGVAVGIDKVSGKVSIETAIQHPKTFYKIRNDDWCSTTSGDRWNKNINSSIYAPGVKTIHDPCPYGWKIPMAFSVSQDRSATNINANSIYTNFGRLKDGGSYYNFGRNNGGSLNGSDLDKYLFYRFNEWVGICEDNSIPEGSNPKGGYLFLIGNATTSGTIYNTVWFPTTSERYLEHGNLLRSGTMSHMWTADWFTYDINGKEKGGFMARVLNGIEIRGFALAIGWPVRCIQDNR